MLPTSSLLDLKIAFLCALQQISLFTITGLELLSIVVITWPNSQTCQRGNLSLLHLGLWCHQPLCEDIFKLHLWLLYISIMFICRQILQSSNAVFNKCQDVKQKEINRVEVRFHLLSVCHQKAFDYGFEVQTCVEAGSTPPQSLSLRHIRT